jgi:hypothetical protein
MRHDDGSVAILSQFFPWFVLVCSPHRPRLLTGIMGLSKMQASPKRSSRLSVKIVTKGEQKRKGGSEVADKLLDAENIALDSCIDALVNNSAIRVPTWKFIRAELAKLNCKVQSRGGLHESDESFHPGATLASEKLDGFKISFLTQVSDIELATLTKVAAKGTDHLNYLISAATLLPMEMKIPDCLLGKAVLLAFMLQRNLDLGSRLSEVAKKGIVGSDGVIDMQLLVAFKTVYNPDDRLISIIHIPTGAVATVGPDYMITRTFMFDKVFDDFQACVELAPMPAIRLSQFFKDGEGPNAAVSYYSKPKDWRAAGQAVFDKHATVSKEKHAYELDSAVLEEVAKAKKVEGMSALETARIAAKKLVAKKASRTKVDSAAISK